MRKLVDAPRKKKQWTEKEEAYLQDKWGTVSIKGLSKALGRSENAIIVRAQRLGCGAHLAGDTRISLNQQRDIYIQRPGSRAETFGRSHQAQDPRPWNQ